jgi:7,8-dihydro-6-hydroxymethylpterin-pyrophosphokinase
LQPQEIVSWTVFSKSEPVKSTNVTPFLNAMVAITGPFRTLTFVSAANDFKRVLEREDLERPHRARDRRNP